MDIVPRKEDIQFAKKLVEVRESPKGGRGGRGVFALVDIPEMTFVGPYPGRVYSNAAHALAKRRKQTTGEYALDFWMVQPERYAPARPGTSGRSKREVRIRPGGNAEQYRYKFDSSSWVIDPADGRGILTKYKHAVAPYINEPSVGERANMYWVYNIALHRVEFWTSETIKKGSELLLCYGSLYPRKYQTSCTRTPATRQYALHYIYDNTTMHPEVFEPDSLHDATQRFGGQLTPAQRQRYINLIGASKADKNGAKYLDLFAPAPPERAKRPLGNDNSNVSGNGTNTDGAKRRRVSVTTSPVTRPPTFNTRRPRQARPGSIAIATPTLNAPRPRPTSANSTAPNSAPSRQAWLAAMHRLLDKPSVSNADVVQVGRLLASKPSFAYERLPLPRLEAFNE